MNIPITYFLATTRDRTVTFYVIREDGMRMIDLEWSQTTVTAWEHLLRLPVVLAGPLTGGWKTYGEARLRQEVEQSALDSLLWLDGTVSFPDPPEASPLPIQEDGQT